MVGIVLVHDRRQRIHRLAVDQDLQLLQLIGAVFEELVIQRGVAARAALELVEEVDDDLGERDFVIELDPVRGRVFLALVDAAPLGDQVHDRAVVIGGRDDLDVHPRLADLDDQALIGQVGRRVDNASSSPSCSSTSYSTVGAVKTMSRSYSRSSRSWMISMWNKPRKPAAETETQRLGGLGFEGQRGVVELQLFQASRRFW